MVPKTQHLLLALTLAWLSFVPRMVFAQAGAGKAAAEALFNEGVELTSQGDFAPACEKFAASQKLDPAVGTMLRLADCYDQLGRSASAWALFVEVQSLAASKGQTRRSEIAALRAGELSGRLTHLRIQVNDAPPGLSVEVNGVVIPEVSFGAPLPVDPGTLKIRASAEGYTSWESELDVPDQSQAEVEVPALKVVPKPATVRKTPAEGRRSAAEAQEAESSAWPAIGWITSGVGLASLGAAGFFTYRAHALNQRSFESCQEADRSLCSEAGLADREDAGKMADLSTIVGASGGVLLGTGLIILWASSDGDEAPPSKLRAAKSQPLQVSLLASSGGGGVLLRGGF